MNKHAYDAVASAIEDLKRALAMLDEPQGQPTAQMMHAAAAPATPPGGHVAPSGGAPVPWQVDGMYGPINARIAPGSDGIAVQPAKQNRIGKLQCRLHIRIDDLNARYVYAADEQDDPSCSTVQSAPPNAAIQCMVQVSGGGKYQYIKRVKILDGGAI